VISLRLPDGAPLCRECRVAASFLTRFRGLMGRAGLEPEEGLAFRTSSVHTSFMRFPIDVVFLADGLEVLKIVPAMKAWRLAGCRGATWTVELPPGTCEARGLRVGDVLSVDPPDGLRRGS
jgi:uncharacterized membrane protein (UPF0127 family)